MPLTPDMKGFIGEQEVLSVLKRLESDGLKVLQDVVLPRPTTVTQIDFVIFSTKIFLCLEVKSWCGEVFVPIGNEGWRTVYGSRSIPIHSPIEQNELHVKVANDNSWCGVNYKNYVVFPKNPIIHNKLYNTGTISDLIGYIHALPDIYPVTLVEQEYNHFKELTMQYYPMFIEKECKRRFGQKTNFFDGDEYD